MTAPAEQPQSGHLLRTNRAAILRRLGTPVSTSHLAALTGLSLGSVSEHLRMLLDAGAVTKRRSGREVLYWRTSLGAAPTDETSDPLPGCPGLTRPVLRRVLRR